MRARGFTLVEIAVSLTIIALVIGMFMIPLSTQFDQQKIAETRTQLEQVREAVIGFAIAKGRLPCPATATTASGSAGAGTENRSGSVCGLSEGALPWASLGVPELDAWGRRFTYRVSSLGAPVDFADDPSGMQASFLLTDDGNIIVTDGAANIATTLPAVIVSHGKNGLGAFRSDGTQIAGAAGDELENADGDTTFVSRLHAPNYDDQLVWVSGAILKSRMVAAGRLP